MFFELSRAFEVEGGMAPEGIVEPVDIAANSLVGLLAGVEDSAPDELGFQGLEERLDHGVMGWTPPASRRRFCQQPRREAWHWNYWQSISASGRFICTASI